MARPTTDPKPTLIAFRLSRGDQTTLTALERELGASKSDALRFALRAAAQQLGLTPHSAPAAERRPTA